MHVPPIHRAALRAAGFSGQYWRRHIACTSASWARGRLRVSAFEGMPGAAVIWTLFDNEREVWRGHNLADVMPALERAQ